MKFAELVATRMKAMDAMSKRMAARPTTELAEKLGTEMLAAQAKRIEQRIKRLEGQRAATLARIDTALETEHAALQLIRKMAKDMPAARRGKEGQPAKAASVRRAAPTAKAELAGSRAAKTRVAKARPIRARTSKAKAPKKK